MSYNQVLRLVLVVAFYSIQYIGTNLCGCDNRCLSLVEVLNGIDLSCRSDDAYLHRFVETDANLLRGLDQRRELGNILVYGRLNRAGLHYHAVRTHQHYVIDGCRIQRLVEVRTCCAANGLVVLVPLVAYERPL